MSDITILDTYCYSVMINTTGELVLNHQNVYSYSDGMDNKIDATHNLIYLNKEMMRELYDGLHKYYTGVIS